MFKECRKVSQNGINLITRFEGCRLKAYKCVGGVWTIGYGHTSNVKPNQSITREEAERLLKQDLLIFEKYTDDITRHLKLNQNQFDALVSFCYNCGSGSLKNLLRNRTDKNKIADAILLYNKSNGKVYEGLKRRREAERKLFLS